MTDVKLKNDSVASALWAGTAIAGLASSSTLLAGLSSTSIVLPSSSLRPMDMRITGFLQTNGSSTPTAGGKIQLWLIEKGNTWPNGFDGTNKAVTVDGLEELNGYGVLLYSRTNAASQNQKFDIRCSWSAFGGGPIPDEFLFWITQSTGQALHASASHLIQYEVFYPSF